MNIKIAADAVALADPNSTRIVIHNFLTNAIKYLWARAGHAPIRQ